MRRGWVLAALLLLGGCGFQSFEPLIAESEQPAAIGGRYEIHIAAGNGGPSSEDEAEMKCLTAGEADPVTGKPRTYCSFTEPEDRGDLPQFIEIEPRGTAFVVRAVDERRAPEDSEAQDVRFLQLAPAIFLVQQGEVEGGRFGYFFAHVIEDGVELYFPGCERFRKGTQPFTAQYEVSCTADSLAALRPELDAYTAEISARREMPLAFLKRF